MRKTLRKYLVWITLIFLLVLMFLQIRWIVYSIRFQEKIFQNSINLALGKTIASLNNDQYVCNLMRDCMRCDTLSLDDQLLSHGIWDKIHQSIDDELAAFDVYIDFDLFIIRNNLDTLQSGKKFNHSRSAYYTQSLQDILQTNGYELVVRVPGRTTFLPREAALMLGSSVILILLILISLLQMVRLYKNELQLLANIRDLINNITHEFKTPISSIALAANMIRKGRFTGQPEKLQEYAGLIVNENQKLQRQVDSLLDLAAIEWDEFEYRKELIGLNDLALTAAQSIQLLLEEKDGNIEIDLKAEKDNLTADKVHITNAILNLLTNAVKYADKKPQIRLSSYNREDKVILEVSDNGVGIPLKYQRFIFDKYFRVPTGDVHNIKGFGIGLSYVKSVVEAHGGKVTVVSEPGKGSSFYLTFGLSD